MEREKKNPFVTKNDLVETENRLNIKIDAVDRKVDTNHADVERWLAVSEKTNENIVEGNRNMVNAIKELSVDMKDIAADTRGRFEDVSVKLSKHDISLMEHNQYIKSQKDVADNKKKHLLQWVAALSTIFVAILAGIFGIVEVIIPILLGGE